ncbi:MAG: DUF2846 domain-containing protein [Thermodesulfobacteriota bacterium]|nr:DUF2846 domain-containing protein [Thermodesulfobacteriota bacterium]
MKSTRFNEWIFQTLLVVFLLSITITMLSCTTGPRYRKVETVPEGKSAVYFYRPSRFFAGARSPAIYDNGIEILSGLSNGGYWVYFPDVGKHSFSTVADFLNSSSVTIKIERPGEEHFIRMDMLQGLVAATAKLYLVYPEQAREEIITCKFVK